MNQHEIKKIIEEEKLTRINWFNESQLSENQVGIKKDSDRWTVYITDERANVVDGSIIQLEKEEEAYDMLLRKGRFAKRKFG
ncbi:hypothetical protein R2R35_22880 [Anaerocolumna sp. AGMB13020]|uniref:hypothetical protein n=1 Tax=Anaerocolumna sp. AGMB13020 TaxID=3081750 RepID=UPI00295408D7|nr:hypothetical protein [Anaerocolumna sp. AGMB13020]WOO36603.1 hypothetical protein R2R35_22880 [Anaerocolumna sp. AGMB13020]